MSIDTIATIMFNYAAAKNQADLFINAFIKSLSSIH